MRLRWFGRAKQDRDNQIRYIAGRNPIAAVDQDHLIDHAVSTLREHPEIGRLGRRHHTREMVISGTSFIAVYRIDRDLNEIHILRILHARQKWPPE